MARITHVEGQLGREALTARQRDIAALVARGYTNQQIAAELVISQGTAVNHVQQILRRAGLASRAELAAWASQRGLATDQNRLLSTLERLLEIDPSDLESALVAAAQAVAEALGADKVDAFLFESGRQPWLLGEPARRQWPQAACPGTPSPACRQWRPHGRGV